MILARSYIWLVCLGVSVFFSIVMGIGLVWLSIEQTDKAYKICQLQNELCRKAVFKNKLEVERERLIAPFELARKAAALNMHEAKPGQVRRVLHPQINIP